MRFVSDNWRPVLTLLLCILLYNMHGFLPHPDRNIVFNFVQDHYRYVKIDMNETDPRNLWRFGLNAGYGVAFLLLCWPRWAAFGVMSFCWFMLQAAEVYWTGNIIWSDWPDWITFIFLFLGWIGWVHRLPIKDMTLRIVHSKWRK